MGTWIKRILRIENAPADPRTMLLAAIADFGHASLVPQAERFFDDHHGFCETMLEHALVPQWHEEARDPELPELAYEVFYFMLTHNGYIGYINWSHDVEAIILAFDELLERSGAPHISDAERAAFNTQAAGAERGQEFIRMFAGLSAVIRKRGLVLVYFILGDEAQHPVLLTPHAHRRWRSARFGKDYAVIPYW